jgi:hypothetical protein
MSTSPFEDNSAGHLVGAFNPLTDNLNDLRERHDQCLLWPEISPEFSRIEDIIWDAQTFLQPLLTSGPPQWAIDCGLGISRSNLAIHQYMERYETYPAVVRALWTTRVPRTGTTLSDSEIYALLAIDEARMAAEYYCEIVGGIEDAIDPLELVAKGSAHVDAIRMQSAAWERELWHSAAQQTGAAEKFLIMASVAQDLSAASPQTRQAEATIATLERKARATKAALEPYRTGRKPKAYGVFKKALITIAREAGSFDVDVVMGYIDQIYDEPIENIRITDVINDQVHYVDLRKNLEKSIAVKDLKAALHQLSQI